MAHVVFTPRAVVLMERLMASGAARIDAVAGAPLLLTVHRENGSAPKFAGKDLEAALLSALGTFARPPPAKADALEDL
jgi:hypothetical protein